jgi:excinuclease ABC subunit C
MLGADGAVLYVGKSKHVRVRLLGYFRERGRDKGARILRETFRIEWSYAPNEFAALREELALIKRHRPPFNVASKRDRSHYCFLRIAKGSAPKLVVHKGSRGRITGEGLCYGPFLGPEAVTEAARELSDALGLRDCADDVPMRYSDQQELIPLGPRTPGCIRYEIRKCLGPCIGACSAAEYDDRVTLARAFLEGDWEGPVDRFRREMERHAGDLAYERAAVYRDRLRRLETLKEQFGRLHVSLEKLSFVYPVQGFGGEDKVYLVRRGTVRAELAAPTTTPERLALGRRIDEVYGPGEPGRAPVRMHEIDEILLVSAWFRRKPEELAKTWGP